MLFCEIISEWWAFWSSNCTTAHNPGPLTLDSNLVVKTNKDTWCRHMHCIFWDQPVCMATPFGHFISARSPYLYAFYALSWSFSVAFYSLGWYRIFLCQWWRLHGYWRAAFSSVHWWLGVSVVACSEDDIRIVWCQYMLYGLTPV